MNDALKNKLLKSDAVKSIQQETKVYDIFKQRDWKVRHSPFFIDSNSGKLREVDITARKYWQKKKEEHISLGIEFVVECKSINNYHVIANNSLDEDIGKDIESSWIGLDTYDHYKRLIKIFEENKYEESMAQLLIDKIDGFCFPNGLSRFSQSKPLTFDIPIFNSFRETNIGTTKEIEASVVWKSFQSLRSYIKAKDSLLWGNIEYTVKEYSNRLNILSDNSSIKNSIEGFIKEIKIAAKHIELTHPVLVVDCHLWELTNGGLKNIPYMRLAFQQAFNMEMWIDVVSIDNLEDYFQKSRQYDDFLVSSGFENK